MIEPAAKKQISTELSSRQVTLSPRQPTAVFDATVYNDSDRFASFQLKLVAAGAMTNGSKPWYRLTPSVSSKIPIGDCTRFQVEVFDLPPIDQQFRGTIDLGTIDLTVEVTSRELTNQYDRQPLRLLAEGLQGQPPGLSLLLPVLEASPGDTIAITGQVSAPTGSAIDVTLRLQGLPDRWFPEGIQQTVTLLPGKPQKVSFTCELPAPIEARSQEYPLRLEATGRFPSVTATGQLQVLPAGSLNFACEPSESAIPEHLGRWQNPTQGTAEFALQFDNLSNLEPGIEIAVQKQVNHRWWQRSAPIDPSQLPAGVTLGELPAVLPIGLSAVPLRVQRRLPWLGWTRRQQFQVKAHLPDSAIALQPDTQTIQVHLFPVIPLWQQLLGALLGLGLGALAWMLLNDPGHRGAVNSVRFSGQGTEVLSGSDDQTIRRWQVQDQSLQTQTRIGNLNKSVRVVRYRPVNNDQVALGFENGEIQLANLLTGQRSRFTTDKDDRVFDLVFSRDARTLYSGHGSGLVLQWDLSRATSEQTKPQQAFDLRFAINSMALVGDDRYLAIGGRYNRLVLLDLNQQGAQPPKDTEDAEAPEDAETEPAATPKAAPTPKVTAPKATAPKAATQLIELTYTSGGSIDYISSLSAAEQQPNLLAVADTKGQISLWDTETCLKNRGRCKPIDSWQSGTPVRSLALSANGCFLASAGDEGQVKLWALDGRGSRRANAPQGRVLSNQKKSLNAVDVIQIRDRVSIVSGGDDGRVQLHQVRFAGDNRFSDRCPGLVGGGS